MTQQLENSSTAVTSPRAHELATLVHTPADGHDPGWRAAFSELFADAILEVDIESLTAIIDAHRELVADGRDSPCTLEPYVELAHTFGQRFRDTREVDRLEPGSLPAQILCALLNGPVVNAELLPLANDDRTSLSRACAKLRKYSHVSSEKDGRSVTWRLTPKGTALARRLEVRSRYAAVASPIAGDWIPLQADLMEKVNAAWHKAGTGNQLASIYSDATGSASACVTFGAAVIRDKDQEVRFTLNPESGDLSGFSAR